MHANNCVHRDLKLENIMFAEDNSLRVVDFGLAAEVKDNGKLDLTCGSIQYVRLTSCTAGGAHFCRTDDKLSLLIFCASVCR